MSQYPAGVVRVCTRIVSVLCLFAVPATAATHPVPPGGDLQSVLNVARPGDLILLAPGATYIGNFRLPYKGVAADVITIRTNARPDDLPGPGTRITPADAALLAKIKSPNTRPALSTMPGTHHWRIELLEFQANAKGAGDIILLGASEAQTQLAQMPHHLVFDRVYVHGDRVVGQKRGIALNCGAAEIRNSYISDIKAVGQDSQAIAGWNGSGPFLIENNYLEAAGENILFGGADASVRGLVPSDITIRGNLVSKPLRWRTERWQVKNALELKNARRVLIEDNIFEHVWSAAQNGFAILFTTKNTGGHSPWTIVEDVTFRYNVIRHAGSAINVSGMDVLHASQQGRRYQISHNLVYDVGGSTWGGAGIFLQVGNRPRDLTVTHNTVFHRGNVIAAYGTHNGGPAVIEGFVFRDNVMRHNRYGVKGAGFATGTATLAGYFEHVTFDRNVLAGGSPSAYPSGNFFPTLAEFAASFGDGTSRTVELPADSPFRAMASDGTAVGADIPRVLAAGSVAASAPAQTLPTGWASVDIGAVAVPGAANAHPGAVVVEGAGRDIWGHADAFHFAYTTLTGDGVLIARVSSIETAHPWTKAGVMMRDTLLPNARHAFMLASAGKGLAFQRRPVTGGASRHTFGGSASAPSFLKLARTGPIVTASHSRDGVQWTTVGTETIAMGPTVYVGLAVSSHVTDVRATATFDSVSVHPGTSAAPLLSAPTVSGPVVAGHLRLLHWNAHHGGTGTDGKYQPDRFATWIAQLNPDVVSLNEMDNQAQVDRITSLLRTKTGRTWAAAYDGRGNAVLSHLPITGQSVCLVNPAVGRKAAHLSLLVEGRPVNIWSAHLDVTSSSVRTGEVSALLACNHVWPEARIVAGDFNAQPASAEITRMARTHADAWSRATAIGATSNYVGNCDGCTRKSRIDYVFASHTATVLQMRSAHVFDTRDGRGVMPSDHKPLLVIYAVK